MNKSEVIQKDGTVRLEEVQEPETIPWNSNEEIERTHNYYTIEVSVRCNNGEQSGAVRAYIYSETDDKEVYGEYVDVLTDKIESTLEAIPSVTDIEPQREYNIIR